MFRVKTMPVEEHANHTGRSFEPDCQFGGLPEVCS